MHGFTVLIVTVCSVGRTQYPDSFIGRKKTVPALMGTVIDESPMLFGVCTFGRGFYQAGVLMEPKSEHAIDVAEDKQVA